MKKHPIRQSAKWWVGYFGAIFLYATLGLAMSTFFGIGLAEAEEKVSLTVAMSLTPLSSPVIIAENKGYFAANGLNVTVKDFVGGHRTIKAVFEGKADIATSSEAVVMFNSMKRSDFAVISTFVISDNDVKIITRKDTGIRKVSDLAGRSVGTITGTSAQFFLDQTILLTGIDRSKITVIHVPPGDISSALADKKVDAIAVWEPGAYHAKKKLGNQALEVSHDRVAPQAPPSAASL